MYLMYFVAIFQVAQNPLKLVMLTLFVLKNVPVYFFHKQGNKASNLFMKVHPPPPPPYNLWERRQNTHKKRVSSQGWKSYIVCRWTERERERGGGRILHNLSIFF